MSPTSATVVTCPKSKSVGVTILLTSLFGPLGMLYSTVIGAWVMLVVSVIVGTHTFGVGLLYTQPVCIIWGAISASSANKESVSQELPRCQRPGGEGRVWNLDSRI